MILDKEKYLYLLPLKMRPFFKIGISSGDFSRVYHLNQLYDFDLDKALIVKSLNHKLITLTEREILTVFEHRISDFKKMDGGSEIRKIEVWDSVIELLNYKKKYSDIVIEPFNVLKVDKEKKLPLVKEKVTSEVKTMQLQKKQRFNNVDFLLSADDFMAAFDFVFDKVDYIEKRSENLYYVFHFKNNQLPYKNNYEHLYHKLSILLSLKSPKYDSIHRLGCYGMQMGYDRVYIEKIEFQFKYFEDFKKDASECNFKHWKILNDIISTIHSCCSDFIETQNSNG